MLLLQNKQTHVPYCWLHWLFFSLDFELWVNHTNTTLVAAVPLAATEKQNWWRWCWIISLLAPFSRLSWSDWRFRRICCLLLCLILFPANVELLFLIAGGQRGTAVQLAAVGTSTGVVFLCWHLFLSSCLCLHPPPRQLFTASALSFPDLFSGGTGEWCKLSICVSSCPEVVKVTMRPSESKLSYCFLVFSPLNRKITPVTLLRGE